MLEQLWNTLGRAHLVRDSVFSQRDEPYRSRDMRGAAPRRVDEASTLDPAARRIYLANCLAAVHGGLARHTCAAGRARTLREALDGHLAGLVGGAAGALLARCGLAEARA